MRGHMIKRQKSGLGLDSGMMDLSLVETYNDLGSVKTTGSVAVRVSFRHNSSTFAAEVDSSNQHAKRAEWTFNLKNRRQKRHTEIMVSHGIFLVPLHRMTFT